MDDDPLDVMLEARAGRVLAHALREARVEAAESESIERHAKATRAFCPKCGFPLGDEVYGVKNHCEACGWTRPCPCGRPRLCGGSEYYEEACCSCPVCGGCGQSCHTCKCSAFGMSYPDAEALMEPVAPKDDPSEDGARSGSSGYDEYEDGDGDDEGMLGGMLWGSR